MQSPTSILKKPYMNGELSPHKLNIVNRAGYLPKKRIVHFALTGSEKEVREAKIEYEKGQQAYIQGILKNMEKDGNRECDRYDRYLDLLYKSCLREMNLRFEIFGYKTISHTI